MADREVIAHYDAVAARYGEQWYQRDRLFDVKLYPSNYFRLQILVESLVRRQAKRVVEIGVGEGTPLGTLAQAGMEVWGFDISPAMVEQAKATVKKFGIDEDRISCGDIQDSLTYAALLRESPFDAVVAMGVMPHVRDDDLVLEHMAGLLRSGGTLFVEFRNKLFSLFTFNRYTVDFVVNDLLAGVSAEIRAAVRRELEGRVAMDKPPARTTVGDDGAPGYDAIPSKFHNPLELSAILERHAFQDLRFHWYHYHPALPFLEETFPRAFREEAFKLERESSGWRGLFLCSAFVIEARKS